MKEKRLDDILDDSQSEYLGCMRSKAANFDDVPNVL